MRHTELQIETADGQCPTHVFHPDGPGPWPAVIVYMDAIGIRPAMMEIAETIARDGYYVLLPDLFYRVEFDGSQAMKLFSDPVIRQDIMTRVVPSASPPNVMRDTKPMLAHLESRPDVRSDLVGLTGYCMGGRLSLYAAGFFGERITASASYHAGGLATDSPESPHRLAASIRARIYVAGAIRDAGFDEAQKARLERALTEAHVDHEIETYEALHGFVPRDTPVHDAAAAERHWGTLLTLFAETLKADPS